MSADPSVRSSEHWDVQYREAEELPWETGRPASELVRVVQERSLSPCRAVEFGCGTGTNAVWLAGRGFQVTAIDLSPRAIRQARRRAAEGGVSVEFLTGDLTAPGTLQGPFDFFLDCGCYHAARLAGAEPFLRTVGRITRPGALGLVLTGNAHEPEDAEGPPVLREQDLIAEWCPRFDVVELREIRFDPPQGGGKRYLGWSCLVRRPA